MHYYKEVTRVRTVKQFLILFYRMLIAFPRFQWVFLKEYWVQLGWEYVRLEVCTEDEASFVEILIPSSEAVEFGRKEKIH